MNTIIKKLFAFGFVTITVPFGAGVGTGVVSTTNPTAVNSVTGTNTSQNWSGYEATTGTFTAVSGTWTIPSVLSASSTQADATWIGIGGVTGHDLVQAGTQGVINGSGAPVYEAWYETLPQATQQVPLTVSPGDSMTASLTQVSTGQWSVSIRDNTTGQSYQLSLPYSSSLSSAEWIEEMPTSGNGFVPLDNFGTSSFSNGMTTQNGNSVTIAGSGAQVLTMVTTGGQALATPSALGADGESFTVTRTSVSSISSGNGFGGGGGYYVTRGVGRGWRRTGVGIEGFTPRPRPMTVTTVTPTPGSTSTGNGTGSDGFGFTGGGRGYSLQELYALLQQLQQLQQAQGQGDANANSNTASGSNFRINFGPR